MSTQVMEVESQIPFSSFEDFFNIDMTPTQDVDSFFNFYGADEFSKQDLFPNATSPFDFLASLTSADPFASSSRSISGSATGATDNSSPIFAIDPQLVGTPSNNSSPESAEDQSSQDNGDALSIAATSPEELEIPVKVGGKGKNNRRGTVQSGGIVKKAPVVKERPSAPQSIEENREPDDWRPSPEEYKKMSSKEKRQLRNKISARNFRVRRKEYITTLEADVAERDRLIDAIRSELGSTKSENHALKQEVEILKKSLLQANPAPVLPPPAPLPAISAAATVAARNSAPSPAPSSPLLAPNPNKDLPSSPRLVSTRSGFWGGGSNPFGTMGGFTPVHTTLVPELSLSTLAGKGLLTPPSKPLLQENLNPALNGVKKPTVTPQQEAAGLHSPSQFDSFVDLNPFTMKSMDLYRMSLWSNVGTQKQSQQQQQLHQAPHFNGLAAALLPHYFAAATTKPSTSPVVPSKTPKYPTPALTPDLSSKATPQEAVLASLASQTLLAKLGSAFWEAFSGQSPRKGVDADKVRKVLEGKAVVRVVDVDEPGPQPKLKRATVTTSITTSPKVSQKSMDLKSCQSCVTELLEESMRSLSISKRGPL
ncbi:hypothetical protein BDM02DRAFT_3153142 [Thelephora ganbajun]|uniref:Uncharacterized protein n=1 Tax=Thelephora ganbajun TaxID=370292 RepID=A0ACB6ZVP5_THEGA|nr:hypothetical protein BDM02DRAFT_3153142 [Thelephora ganbajun]